MTDNQAIAQEMTVQRVFQSPLNPNRWVLVLSCGHETWITQKSKPKRMKAMCPICKEIV